MCLYLKDLRKHTLEWGRGGFLGNNKGNSKITGTADILGI